MRWLQHVIIDLAATAVILLAVATGANWAYWVVVVYTPIMLVVKIVGYFGRGIVRQAKTTDEVPKLFYHAIYVISIAALAWAGWWLLSAAWLVIWVLSILTERPVVSRRPVRGAVAKK
jgi:hypothetical protein